MQNVFVDPHASRRRGNQERGQAHLPNHELITVFVDLRRKASNANSYHGADNLEVGKVGLPPLLVSPESFHSMATGPVLYSSTQMLVFLGSQKQPAVQMLRATRFD